MARKDQTKNEKKLIEEAIIETLKGMAMMHWVMTEFSINPEQMEKVMKELIDKYWINDDTVKIDSSLYGSISKIALELFKVLQQV